MFLSSGMGSGPSWVAPWTPWIDRKIQKEFSKNRFFGHSFHIGPLAGYIRPFEPIILCWEPSRVEDFDWSFTLS